ncbi:hypothetical protein ACTD5D_35765 [Nocardia takedensis]|nr:hypothetical protein [Nocardia takedensis]
MSCLLDPPTALVHGLTVATRNIRDLALPVINLWLLWPTLLVPERR